MYMKPHCRILLLSSHPDRNDEKINFIKTDIIVCR